MAHLRFTPNIQRHVACGDREVAGGTVREVLEAYFEDVRDARGYVVDDQGALRHHMTIFVDGRPIADRQALSDPVEAGSEVYVFQALSGG